VTVDGRPDPVQIVAKAGSSSNRRGAWHDLAVAGAILSR
jgi:hypothetical protein